MGLFGRILKKLILKIFKTDIENLKEEVFKKLQNEINLKTNQLSSDTMSKTENLFYSNYGYTKKIDDLDFETRQKIYIQFQYKEKAKVALSVVSSYRGGHYLEFGSHGLNTFKNFLASFYIAELEKKFPKTKFYAFDVFGSVKKQDILDLGGMFHNREWEENQSEYFAPFLTQKPRTHPCFL